MPRRVVTPIRARRIRRFVVLIDARGGFVFIRMPNRDCAIFCAAALNISFRSARRAGE